MVIPYAPAGDRLRSWAKRHSYLPSRRRIEEPAGDHSTSDGSGWPGVYHHFWNVFSRICGDRGSTVGIPRGHV